MELDDRVVSEVHCFSNSETLLTTENGGKGDRSPLFINSIHQNERMSNSEATLVTENSADELYTCLLGLNGEVVLWNAKYQTVLSRFEFTYPDSLKQNANESLQVELDKDGDLEVKRKSSVGKEDGIILIEHQNSTTLDLVGEQVWRGAFFLADLVLHNWKEFKGANVLELASGVGLTSVVAAMVAKRVIATDIDRGEILQLIQRNFDRNSDLTSAETLVKVVDFFDSSSLDDLSSVIDDVDYVLAADVVYNDKLTDAFFNTLRLLLKPKRVFFIALEKRYVFTIEDLDTVAPCYEHFVTQLERLRTDMNTSLRVEEICRSDIPQYFAYERTEELVLWRITSL